ncbi:hypothetical protein II906_02330 [bacterium]|nr:hypothetical protein [bacterium]
MIKLFISVVCLFSLFFSLECSANELGSNSSEPVLVSSASSLKYEMNSYKREILLNERKIRQLKASKSITPANKARNISKLETRNRYLKRKISKTKSEYMRALS